MKRFSRVLSIALAFLASLSISNAFAHHNGGRTPIGGVGDEVSVVDIFGRQTIYLTPGVGTRGGLPLSDVEGPLSLVTSGVHGGESPDKRVVVINDGYLLSVSVNVPRTVHFFDEEDPSLGGVLCYLTTEGDTSRFCTFLGERYTEDVLICQDRPHAEILEGRVGTECEEISENGRTPIRGCSFPEGVTVVRSTTEECELVQIYKRRRVPTRR